MSGDPAAEVRAALRVAGLEWPAPIEFMAEVGSTSDVLRALAEADSPEWTVVLAGRQTAGRGRHGRRWASPPGHLYMSVLLRPRPSVRLSLIPLAAGVAVKEALAANGVEARLKWPNDVLVGGRKVAGVLGEGIASGPGVQSVVLGVGINVADDGSLPDELRELATSLDAERHAATPLAGLAAAVLVRLRACYSVLAVAPGDVLAAWRQSALPWWGRMVEVDAGVERIAGLARGVDERGALLLELADGAVVPVLAGEARELRPR